MTVGSPPGHGPAVRPSADSAAAGTGPWLRLHPLSPALRSWKLFVALIAVVGQEQARHSPFPARALALVAGAVLVAVVPVTWLSWRRTTWRVEDGDLRMESGILVRRSRRVPLARLQAVDIVRPLVARALGLAEVRLEVVGHGRSEATLSYLTEDDAHAVRARLLAVAHGVAADTPAPHEAVLAEVPSGRLATAVVLSAAGWWGLLALGYVVATLAIRPALAAGAALAVLPAATVAANRFAAEFGFTVAQSPDGLRLRHGLLETRAQTVPRGRVQAVRVLEPWLWRRLGWARVEIDVAGYGSGARGAEQRASTAALLPVAPRREAIAMAERVLGAALPAGLHEGPLTDRPAVRPPRRARWRAPLSWPHLGVSHDDGFTVTSAGRLRIVTDIVPHDKIQSLRQVQGPWQRRLRVSTVHLDTAGRSVSAAARHRDEQQSAALLAELTVLARQRRGTVATGEPGAAPRRPAQGDPTVRGSASPRSPC